LIPEDEILFGLIAQDGTTGKAYQLAQIRAAGGLLQDEFDGKQVVLILQGEFQVGAYTVPNGTESLPFKLVSTDPIEIEDQRGHRWNLWGQPSTGESHDSGLTPADGYLVEWYEWLYSFPETELFGN
jgi:hypothetical protein